MNALIDTVLNKNNKDEEKLLRIVQELQNIKYALDQSSIVAITDINGVIEYVNDKFVEISKYSKKELIGNTHRLINSRYHPEEFFRVLWTTIKSGKVWRGEIRNRAKNGKFYWVDTTITPLFDVNGKPFKFIAIRTEITKRKELERQKDDFVGIVSHELKTPVTSIKAFAQVLEKRFLDKGDAKSAFLLSKVNSQIDKLTSLINNLLDVTRIEAGKIIFNKEEFSFDELVNEIREEIQRTTIDHKIIRKGFAKKIITGDRNRIGEVIVNFLTNAIKYSNNTDNIIIEVKADKKSVILSVQDFGMGIPEEKLLHLFERFYRVTGGRQDSIPGIGLGLYISSEIIRRHGGKIWVESSYDKTSPIGNHGSKFFFELPLKMNIETGIN